MSESRILIHEPWTDRKRELAGYAFGMWVFLATEILFFGALFFFYAVNRWAHPNEVDMAAKHTDVVFGTLNTAILMTSSLSIATAERALEAEVRGVVRLLLWATLALGLSFLVVKGFEYHKDLEEHLWPAAVGFALGDVGARPFWSFYWLSTGVHAIHVTIGLGLIVRLIVLAHARALPPRLVSMQVTTLYWHLVDIIWVILYSVLYLVGRP